MSSQVHAAERQTSGRALPVVVVGLVLGLALGLPRPGDAAVLECASGDVACLIAAIHTANANGQANTIRLQSGTYTLSAVDNDTDGANGLPSITSALALVGAGPAGTTIERDASAPLFRLLHVGQTGSLKLQSVTARGGRWGGPSAAFGGGGILNLGTVVIGDSILTGNVSTTEGLRGGGGGIVSLGRLLIAGSTIADNTATIGFGGGVFGSAGVTVVKSTISGNTASDGGGGLWTAASSVTLIIDSTIADNRAGEGHGGGLLSESTAVTIINSTLARNSSAFGFGGGLFVSGGIIVNATIADNESDSGGQALVAGSALALHNTIVSGPSSPLSPLCRGQVSSLDNNLLVDPGCAVALMPQDLTGDARLGDFTDDGSPGHGFVPLLKRSPALNAGDSVACLPADQLGRRRNAKGCDIGAVEGTH